MGNSSRVTLDKIEGVTQPWSKLCPGKSFAGLTLEQFVEAIKPSHDVRAEIAEAQLRLQAALARRATVDRASLKIVQRVINAVKADPEEGDDGELYAAMGFVRRSDRSTGLTRRKREESSPQEAAADPPAKSEVPA